jgi:putative transposase
LAAVEIVRKNPDQVGFAVNPRRWVVERFFASAASAPDQG